MAAMAHEPLRGELQFDEPLARHTSWRVGGPADRFYRPADKEDLAAFLQSLPPGEPVTWLGLGSNVLVRDGGVRGTVIGTQGRLNAIELLEGDRLRAGAGAACAVVARTAARAGLGGAGFLAGIPGTVGGALAMNAGAFGGETWRIVVAVETVDRAGVLRRRGPEDFAVGYRSVRGPVGEWFVEGEFQCGAADVAAEQQRIRDLLARRAATQPTGLPSGGSTFRNPEGDHAARLIEAAGLKGFRIGGAEVSPKHANFVINAHGASAADIEALIAHMRATVAERFGVDLVTEVKLIGEPA